MKHITLSLSFYLLISTDEITDQILSVTPSSSVPSDSELILPGSSEYDAVISYLRSKLTVDFTVTPPLALLLASLNSLPQVVETYEVDEEGLSGDITTYTDNSMKVNLTAVGLVNTSFSLPFFFGRIKHQINLFATNTDGGQGNLSQLTIYINTEDDLSTAFRVLTQSDAVAEDTEYTCNTNLLIR